MEATSLRFAGAVRSLGRAARQHGLVLPGFRSPPRVEGDRSLRWRPDGSAVVDGLIDLEDFVERFRLEPPPEEFDVQTAGGYVMALLDRVPQAGDAVDIDGLRVQVREMDGNRVATLLVTRHRES